MKRTLLSMLLALVLVPWMSISAQSCYEYSAIQTTGTNAVPFGTTSSAFSWVQLIYTPARVGGTGAIRSISFLSAAEYQAITDSSLIVYMGTTADSVASTTTSWVPESSLTEVFHSSNYQHIYGSNAWETITLDTPFTYDGSSNLVICIAAKHSNVASFMQYRYGMVTSGAALTRQGATEAFALYPGTATGTKRNMLPFACFCFNGTCNAPSTPVASNVTANGATLTWGTSGAASYQYLCVSDADTLDWTNAQTTTALTATLTGLNANTSYRFYVRSVCGQSQYSNEVLTIFHTDCPATYSIPFFADFDKEVTANDANVQTHSEFVHCWDRICDAANYANQGYPYVSNSSSYQRSGSGKSLYFLQPSTSSTTCSYGYAVLPQVSSSVNSL